MSVVVPVRNGERTVAETIRSLLALDYPRNLLELIFVNNGSRDGTGEILAEHSDVIRVVDEPKSGRSTARNAGIRAAGNAVVAFTDADCIADPAWLSQLLLPLEDSKVGIAGGKILAPRPCNPVEEFGERVHDHERAINFYKPPYAVTANWASRRSVLLETGGFDQNLRRGEDVDLAYRIVQAGYRIVYQDRALIYHRNQPDLRRLFREGLAHGLCSVQVLKKHQGFLREYGHRRVDLPNYGPLAANFGRILTRRADSNTVCETIFNLGKLAGKVLGSVRFGYIEL